jgi:hypothetical protein
VSFSEKKACIGTPLLYYRALEKQTRLTSVVGGKKVSNGEGNKMKRFIIASVVAISLAVASAKANTLAQWTFESFATNNVNTAGPLSPEWGDQTATAIGTAFHSGATTYSEPAGDIDPTIAAADAGATHAGDPSSLRSWSSNGWSVGDYYQFQVSTLGLSSVQVMWDQAGSNTGPRDFLLQYSLNGTSFTTIGGTRTVVLSAWNTSSAQPASFSESGFAGAVDNQATVYFRLVDNSTTSVNGGGVALGGTDRVDNFTVIAVPEPSTVALVGAGLLGLLALRRRRS